MATFQISRLHDAMTLTHIYLISVSINTLTGHADDCCDLPAQASHFSPDINVYAISNFIPSSFVLDRFFFIKLFAIKFSTGIFILCL